MSHIIIINSFLLKSRFLAHFLLGRRRSMSGMSGIMKAIGRNEIHFVRHSYLTRCRNKSVGRIGSKADGSGNKNPPCWFITRFFAVGDTLLPANFAEYLFMLSQLSFVTIGNLNLQFKAFRIHSLIQFTISRLQIEMICLRSFVCAVLSTWRVYN